MIGSISAHLATERALELFAPVQQVDYVGWNGGAIGPKGLDDSVLAGYEILDDPQGAENAAPTIDADGGVCLHTEIEPFEDEPSRGACVECGEEFGVRVPASIESDSSEAATEEEPPVDERAREEVVAAG